MKISQAIYFDTKNQDLNAKNIIITSLNAINGDVLSKLNQDSFFFVVGDSVKNELLKHGIKNVEKFASIFNLTQNINIKDEFLYVRGEDISNNLSKIIDNLREIKTYQMLYKESFDENEINLLKTSNFSRIFLFSKLTCENFIRLVKKANLFDEISKCEIFCMSQDCVKYLENFKIKAKHFNY